MTVVPSLNKTREAVCEKVTNVSFVAILLFFFILGISSKLQAASLTYISQGSNGTMIIFIHGIFGDPIETFKASKSAKSWPELLASDDTPDVRNTEKTLSQFGIATLSFDASRDSHLSIEELSTQVATDLIDAGVFDKYSHVIFIAHSMGGIILKRVMIASAIDQRWHSILARTSGIIFVSVPSKGSAAADFLSKLPRIITGRPILDLTTTSTNTFLSSLDDLWWSFLRKPERALIFCAYETKATLGVPIVPNIYTDTNCDDPPRAENEDHLSIVKPESTDADIYRWTRSRIFEITNNVKPISLTMKNSAVTPALYIKRIFNGPDGPAAENTTVWLGAVGSKKIIVDSMRVVHHESRLLSAFTGAVSPAANYKIVYEPNSDRVYPLNPALILDPDDPKDIAFTADIVPSRTVG